MKDLIPRKGKKKMAKIAPYAIRIQQVENGYTAQVECKTFIFSSLTALCNEMDAYFSGRETDLTKSYLMNIKNAEYVLPLEVRSK